MKYKQKTILSLVSHGALVVSVIVSILGGGQVLATSSTIKAIDTAATITDPNWFKQAYSDGFRLYVMHSTNWGTCDTWWNTQNQLKMALDAGLGIAVYTRDPSCWQGGINAAGPYKDKLSFFALDVESDPGVAVTRQMVDGVKSMGVTPVIYSGSGMWSGVQGATQNDFADVALWDTDVRGAYPLSSVGAFQADLLSPSPVQYGGWNTSTTMRKGVQQYFEVPYNGVNIDLNSFDASMLKIPTTTPVSKKDPCNGIRVCMPTS